MFTCTTLSPFYKQISCPSDYRQWLLTMYILFGTKWAKIFCGPMWSYVPIMQELREPATGLNTMSPVNVSYQYTLYLCEWQ